MCMNRLNCMILADSCVHTKTATCTCHAQSSNSNVNVNTVTEVVEKGGVLDNDKVVLTRFFLPSPGSGTARQTWRALRVVLGQACKRGNNYSMSTVSSI